MNIDHAFLTQVETLLRQSIAPNAAAIDRDPTALQAALHQLGEANLLGLRLPPSHGGTGLSSATFRHVQVLLARYSGALAFLQAQHQSAGALLAQSQNSALKAYLPRMGTGQALVGISVAHLRRAQPPMHAIAVGDEYLLQGQAPWVTGWGCFQSFIVAAVLPEGQVLYGMVPFQTQSQETGGEIRCSEPMELAAMAATNTVRVEFQQWRLSSSDVVAIHARDAASNADRQNVLQPSFFALGCARAGLDCLEAAYAAKPLPFVRSAQAQLLAELLECQRAIFAAEPTRDQFAANLPLRAWAIDLAVRCAHAAVAAWSGAANSHQHPAQRIYREALAFTVSGQTTAVMEATLARLVRSTDATVSPSGWDC